MQLTSTSDLDLVDSAWINAINNRSRGSFLHAHSESVVVYDPTFPQPLKGRTALGSWFDGLFTMFPDYQMKKVRSFGQESWVCLEAEETGTLKGPIHAGKNVISPTGKSFHIPSSIICHVEGGAITEVRVYYDVMTLMGQLGLGR